MKKARKVPDRIKVGCYSLGGEMVNVFVAPRETGGWLYGAKPGQEVSEVVIGINYQHWGAVVVVLVHELTELAYASLRMRYCPDVDWAGASDSYKFFFDHYQFSEATARVGWVLSHCLPEVSRAYKKWGPKQ